MCVYIPLGVNSLCAHTSPWALHALVRVCTGRCAPVRAAGIARVPGVCVCVSAHLGVAQLCVPALGIARVHRCEMHTFTRAHLDTRVCANGSVCVGVCVCVGALCVQAPCISVNRT